MMRIHDSKTEFSTVNLMRIVRTNKANGFADSLQKQALLKTG
jgi:hypothetical protein